MLNTSQSLSHYLFYLKTSLSSFLRFTNFALKIYFFVFPDILKDYPDEFRPSKCLKFFDILPVSAKESPQDVETVKRKLRNLLDVIHDMEVQESGGETNEDIRSSLKEKRPVLL